ncbi:hypothetical protein Tco_1517306 [Tanacetum coccineum]
MLNIKINEKDYRSGRIDIEIKINELKENFNEMRPCPNTKLRLRDFSDIDSVVDYESSHEEVIHEMSFKTYSNPLFDFDKEIISSEFNQIHNEDLDSTLKDVRFDAESYLLESLVNRDTLMASPPKIDFLLDEFAGLGELHSSLINSPGNLIISTLIRRVIFCFLEEFALRINLSRLTGSFSANSDYVVAVIFPYPLSDPLGKI